MENKKSIMHSFSGKGLNLFSLNFIILIIIVFCLGVGTGFLLKKTVPAGVTNSALSSPTDKNAIQKGKSYGSNDISDYKDSVDGTLKEGGIEGEGQYHLQRPGGDSQNVYLTSSSVDLSLFINRKIKVWGETQKAQSAGWLMDVGKVQVLN